jgi:hypothetical protein
MKHIAEHLLLHRFEEAKQAASQWPIQDERTLLLDLTSLETEMNRHMASGGACPQSSSGKKLPTTAEEFYKLKEQRLNAISQTIANRVAGGGGGSARSVSDDDDGHPAILASSPSPERPQIEAFAAAFNRYFAIRREFNRVWYRYFGRLPEDGQPSAVNMEYAIKWEDLWDEVNELQYVSPGQKGTTTGCDEAESPAQETSPLEFSPTTTTSGSSAPRPNRSVTCASPQPYSPGAQLVESVALTHNTAVGVIAEIANALIALREMDALTHCMSIRFGLALVDDYCDKLHEQTSGAGSTSQPPAADDVVSPSRYGWARHKERIACPLVLCLAKLLWSLWGKANVMFFNTLWQGSPSPATPVHSTRNLPQTTSFGSFGAGLYGTRMVGGSIGSEIDESTGHGNAHSPSAVGSTGKQGPERSLSNTSMVGQSAAATTPAQGGSGSSSFASRLPGFLTRLWKRGGEDEKGKTGKGTNATESRLRFESETHTTGTAADPAPQCVQGTCWVRQVSDRLSSNGSPSLAQCVTSLLSVGTSFTSMASSLVLMVDMSDFERHRLEAIAAAAEEAAEKSEVEGGVDDRDNLGCDRDKPQSSGCRGRPMDRGGGGGEGRGNQGRTNAPTKPPCCPPSDGTASTAAKKQLDQPLLRWEDGKVCLSGFLKNEIVPRLHSSTGGMANWVLATSIPYELSDKVAQQTTVLTAMHSAKMSAESIDQASDYTPKYAYFFKKVAITPESTTSSASVASASESTRAGIPHLIFVLLVPIPVLFNQQSGFPVSQEEQEKESKRIMEKVTADAFRELDNLKDVWSLRELVRHLRSL